jgi:hypothetical protein
MYPARLISSLAAARSIASASASGQRQINVSERLEARRFSGIMVTPFLVLRHRRRVRIWRVGNGPGCFRRFRAALSLGTSCEIYGAAVLQNATKFD